MKNKRVAFGTYVTLILVVLSGISSGDEITINGAKSFFPFDLAQPAIDKYTRPDEVKILYADKYYVLPVEEPAIDKYTRPDEVKILYADKYYIFTLSESKEPPPVLFTQHIEWFYELSAWQIIRDDQENILRLELSLTDRSLGLYDHIKEFGISFPEGVGIHTEQADISLWSRGGDTWIKPETSPEVEAFTFANVAYRVMNLLTGGMVGRAAQISRNAQKFFDFLDSHKRDVVKPKELAVDPEIASLYLPVDQFERDSEGNFIALTAVERVRVDIPVSEDFTFNAFLKFVTGQRDFGGFIPTGRWVYGVEIIGTPKYITKQHRGGLVDIAGDVPLDVPDPDLSVEIEDFYGPEGLGTLPRGILGNTLKINIANVGEDTFYEEKIRLAVKIVDVKGIGSDSKVFNNPGWEGHTTRIVGSRLYRITVPRLEGGDVLPIEISVALVRPEVTDSVFVELINRDYTRTWLDHNSENNWDGFSTPVVDLDPNVACNRFIRIVDYIKGRLGPWDLTIQKVKKLSEGKDIDGYFDDIVEDMQKGNYKPAGNKSWKYLKDVAVDLAEMSEGKAKEAILDELKSAAVEALESQAVVSKRVADQSNDVLDFAIGLAQGMAVDGLATVVASDDADVVVTSGSGEETKITNEGAQTEIEGSTAYNFLGISVVHLPTNTDQEFDVDILDASADISTVAVVTPHEAGYSSKVFDEVPLSSSRAELTITGESASEELAYDSDNDGQTDSTILPSEVEEVTAVEDDYSVTIPLTFRLAQNFPNPFNSITQISYDLPEASDVTLAVYALTGQHAATLISGHQGAGHCEVAWDGSEFASGIYFYRLEAGQFTETKRMLLLK